MLRKFLKRWSPDPAALKSSSKLKFLGNLIHDPNIFHLTRHSVSTAFLVGFIICFCPVPVGHIAMVVIASVWFRFNLPISFVLVMLSNPLTFPFIYSAAYLVGSWILQTPPIEFSFEVSWAWFKEIFLEIWKPLVIGCLSFGLFFGVTSYFIIQGLWRWQVITRWRNRRHRFNKKPNTSKDHPKNLS
ncbi:MAG: DUF2062 domain-containing protein [Marinagarivorans sp.]|nr:DUF2062 domain-containing protein [Marinagarivorans sp.]